LIYVGCTEDILEEIPYLEYKETKRNPVVPSGIELSETPSIFIPEPILSSLRLELSQFLII
jgi:hypothetical protein